MYTYNEEYSILKAYDARSFILGLKEVCGVNIDLDKSYIGVRFNYKLLVDGEYVEIYDRVAFLNWIETKVDLVRDNFYSYVTSLDYQIKIKKAAKVEVKPVEVVAEAKVEEVQEDKPVTKKATRQKKVAK